MWSKRNRGVILLGPLRSRDASNLYTRSISAPTRRTERKDADVLFGNLITAILFRDEPAPVDSSQKIW